MKTADTGLRVLSVIFAVIMFVFSTGLLQAVASDLTDSEQDKIDSYNEQKEKLDKDIANNKAKMAELKGSIEKQRQYVSTLQDQIAAYAAQIDVLNSAIAQLESQKAGLQSEIDALQVQIDEIEAGINHNELQQIALQQEIEDTYLELQERLCNIYMYGRTSEIELLLNSTDFKSFLITMELSSNIAKRDNEIVDELNDKIASIDELNAEHKKLIEEREADQASLQADIDVLDEKEQSIAASKAVVENDQADVQALISETMGYIAELNEASDTYQYLVNKYEADKRALDQQIENVIAEAARRNHPSFVPSSGFILPLQFGDVYVSSGYGYRNLSGSYSTFHGGVDLCRWSGTYNQPVVATASGVVIYSGFNGYGNCIMIDHGNSVVSLYGHLNSKSVSVDQTVNQGEVIGYSGNTYGPGGYSTGPHLHFEIRVNGSKVNPGQYVSLP